MDRIFLFVILGAVAVLVISLLLAPGQPIWAVK
jgi:hypothetical protein